MPSTFTLGSWTTTFGFEVLTQSMMPELYSLSNSGLFRTLIQMFIYVALTWLRAAPTFFFFSLINDSKSTSIRPLPAAAFMAYRYALSIFIASIFALLSSRSFSIFWIPFIFILVFAFHNFLFAERKLYFILFAN